MCGVLMGTYEFPVTAMLDVANPLGDGVGQLAGAVGGAVVDDDDLPVVRDAGQIPGGLFDELFDQLFFVEGGSDHGQ